VVVAGVFEEGCGIGSLFVGSRSLIGRSSSRSVDLGYEGGGEE
jgi:hypothetical protein